jgi:hypothetical protein
MFLHQKENEINFNNEFKLSVENFQKLEPNYPVLPTGYTERYYETGKRHDITGSGRTLIQENLNWEDGDRYFNRYEDFKRLHQIIENEELEIKQKVQIELDLRKSYDQLRLNKYPSIEQMVVAMWENLIEKQTKEASGIKDIQKLRKEVKQKYPKPSE